MAKSLVTGGVSESQRLRGRGEMGKRDNRGGRKTRASSSPHPSSPALFPKVGGWVGREGRKKGERGAGRGRHRLLLLLVWGAYEF